MAVLERLAEHLERGALEFGQLVEKKHAVVGKRDFTGPGNRAAAEQADIGDGVVRSAKRWSEPGQRAAERRTGGGVDAQHLEKFIERRSGKNGRDSLGHHGFA